MKMQLQQQKSAKTLLETIEVEKRKLIEVYEFNAEQEF